MGIIHVKVILLGFVFFFFKKKKNKKGDDRVVLVVVAASSYQGLKCGCSPRLVATSFISLHTAWMTASLGQRQWIVRRCLRSSAATPYRGCGSLQPPRSKAQATLDRASWSALLCTGLQLRFCGVGASLGDARVQQRICDRICGLDSRGKSRTVRLLLDWTLSSATLCL